MQGSMVPAPLRERLGPEATSALVDLFEAAELDLQEDVLRLSSDRFERRLTEETSKLRLEMGQLRLEMAQLRQDIREGFLGLRQEIGTLRFEILKWVFVFWVGQSIALLGYLIVLVRALGRA